MSDSHSHPEANDHDRQELLIHFKKLGLATDDQLAQINSSSPDKAQESISILLDKERRYQDYFRQLITIKDIIEKYLSRLVSEMLEGKDVFESLQQGMEIYPSLQLISWLVNEEAKDLTEFIKDLNLDSDLALSILYRWQYEYKPLWEIWWELERRIYGRENPWTSIRRQISYNRYRQIPQVSVQLLSRKKVVWKAQEDIDDIAELVRALLEICEETLSESPEHIDTLFMDGMRETIGRIDIALNKLKALPILNPKNASEESTDSQSSS